MEEDLELITFDGDVITKSDYRDEIINMYIMANLQGLTKITDFTIGSEAYHLADVIASYVLEHRELIDLNYKMSMIHTAEGEFLDNFGDMCGVHRIGSSPSVGTVTFTRLNTDEESLKKPIQIVDGTQIATIDAISFIVDTKDENVYIEPNSMSVDVDVICEQEGEYTNVLENTITLVMGDLGSLVTVTNSEKFEEGADIEDDETYRNRILLSPYNVPCGSLAWYENLSNELESIHDTFIIKGQTLLDADITIVFNPTNRNDIVTRMDLNSYNEDNDYESTINGTMTKGRQDLIELFSMKEYDIVGIKREYHLADEKTILKNENNISYIFGVVLEPNYTLNMVKEDIKNKIEEFSNDASIGLYFNPSVLSLLIENEIEGVNLCKIVSYDGNTYTELLEPIEVDFDEIYKIDMTNINDKIQSLNFNVNLGE